MDAPTHRAASISAVGPREDQAKYGVEYLKTADWVAWVDADIVDYPLNLFSELVKRAEGGIAAPIQLMDGELGGR